MDVGERRFADDDDGDDDDDDHSYVQNTTERGGLSISALLLANSALPDANVMLLTTQVASAGAAAVKSCSVCDALVDRAVLNRQCSLVLAVSHEQRSGPQNASAPICLSVMRKVKEASLESRTPTAGPTTLSHNTSSLLGEEDDMRKTGGGGPLGL